MNAHIYIKSAVIKHQIKSIFFFNLNMYIMNGYIKTHCAYMYLEIFIHRYTYTYTYTDIITHYDYLSYKCQV